MLTPVIAYSFLSASVCVVQEMIPGGERDMDILVWESDKPAWKMALIPEAGAEPPVMVDHPAPVTLKIRYGVRKQPRLASYDPDPKEEP